MNWFQLTAERFSYSKLVVKVYGLEFVYFPSSSDYSRSIDFIVGKLLERWKPTGLFEYPKNHVKHKFLNDKF